MSKTAAKKSHLSGKVGQAAAKAATKTAEVKIVGAVPKAGRLTGAKARIWGDDKDVQRVRERLYG